MLPEKFPLSKKFFVVNFFNQSTYPILNTIVVIWAKVVVEKFLFQSLFGNLFFILKFKVITFIIVRPITKLCFRTAIVLFPTMITFYETYCVFGILLSGLWMWKISSCGPELSATSILGKTDLTRWSFKFYRLYTVYTYYKNISKNVPMLLIWCK